MNEKLQQHFGDRCYYLERSYCFVYIYIDYER